MRTPCNPLCLDMLMWCVAHGASLFRRVSITDAGRLVTTTPIARNDIVAYVPAQLCFSADKLLDQCVPPQLRTNVQTAGQPLAWWPEMTRGHFAMLCMMASMQIRTGGGQSAHLQLLSRLPEVTQFESALSYSAEEAISKPEFAAASQSVIAVSGTEDTTADDVRRELLNAFLAFERRSVVVWSDGVGLPSFAREHSLALRSSAYSGVRALVPLVDLCTHSSRSPTCSVGFPDPQVCEWMMLERGFKKLPSEDAIVLQALRNIDEGEELTVDRMAMNDMAPEEFADWFGHDA